MNELWIMNPNLMNCDTNDCNRDQNESTTKEGDTKRGMRSSDDETNGMDGGDGTIISTPAAGEQAGFGTSSETSSSAFASTAKAKGGTTTTSPSPMATGSSNNSSPSPSASPSTSTSISPVMIRVAKSGGVTVDLDKGVIEDLDLTPASFQSLIVNNKKKQSTCTTNANANASESESATEKKSNSHDDDSKKLFHVTPVHLGDFTKGHEGSSPRPAYIELFQRYLSASTGTGTVSADSNNNNNNDNNTSKQYIETLLNVLEKDEEKVRLQNEISNATPNVPLEFNQDDKDRLYHHLEIAAVAVTTILLQSNPEGGLALANTSTSSSSSSSTSGQGSREGNATVDPELVMRKNIFGSNALTEKKMTSFLVLCWEALQDFVLIMLIIMGVVSIVVETTIGKEENEKCGGCWLEGFAILTSVCIVMLVTASIDYMKQFAFKKLSRSLEARNTKSVVRNGEPVVVTDADIVVGDVLSVNSHSLASIPAVSTRTNVK